MIPSHTLILLHFHIPPPPPQSLKQQLSSLQEELKRRESRWSTTHSRLRQQVEALATDNGALREEVRTLERLRLSTWKSSHADADKDRKDKPGFFESSGTKTVKFAVSPVWSPASVLQQGLCADRV